MFFSPSPSREAVCLVLSLQRSSSAHAHLLDLSLNFLHLSEVALETSDGGPVRPADRLFSLLGCFRKGRNGVCNSYVFNVFRMFLLGEK